jgi:hypothetical protein
MVCVKEGGAVIRSEHSFIMLLLPPMQHLCRGIKRSDDAGVVQLCMHALRATDKTLLPLLPLLLLLLLLLPSFPLLPGTWRS